MHLVRQAAKCLALMVILTALVGAQVHVLAEIDSCQWNPATGQSSPTPIPGHDPCGRLCQLCAGGVMATIESAPQLDFSPPASLLEQPAPHLAREIHPVLRLSSRAPPEL